MEEKQLSGDANRRKKLDKVWADAYQKSNKRIPQRVERRLKAILYGDIPTFMELPHAKKKEDLQDVDVAFVGLPWEGIKLLDPWTILLYPLLTEKAIGKIESENKLVFIVNRKSSKKQIRWATEKAFNVKVVNVKTLIDRKGRKKAWIKLSKKYPAAEIATRLGML